MLNKAVGALRPGRFPVFCLLLLCRSAAGSDRPDTWIQVRSPHFVVASDVGEKRGRRIAQQFIVRELLAEEPASALHSASQTIPLS